MDADTLKTERWNILWATQRSQRYHSRRQAFYERWNKLTAFVGVVGGSTAFAAINAKMPAMVGIVAAAVVVVLSGADLVAGTSEMSRKHNDLRRRFCELEADIAKHPQADDGLIAKWKSARLSIESDEPPTYVVLDVLCENELIRTYPHLVNQKPYPLPWYKRASAHLLIWQGA